MRMNGQSRILALAAMAALVMPLPVTGAPQAKAGSPGARAPGAKGCWYYSEAGFQGERAEIVDGDDLANLGDSWNDKITSISCHPLCTLTAYENEGHGGAQKRFNGDINNLGAWSDKISSMSVTCRRRVRSM